MNSAGLDKNSQYPGVQRAINSQGTTKGKTLEDKFEMGRFVKMRRSVALNEIEFAN